MRQFVIKQFLGANYLLENFYFHLILLFLAKFWNFLFNLENLGGQKTRLDLKNGQILD